MKGIVDMELTPKADDPADVTTLAPMREVSMFERLALDPSVGVDKLERLIELQERIMRHNAEAAFNAAFSKMQPAIPVIDEHGRIEVKGQLRSTYAPLEDIHDVIKPITAQYGFAIRHRTEWPVDKAGIIRIVGILSHEGGHREESIFEAPLDRSDYRTDIQSMGSTVSYGRRYTTLDLLNIATRKADTDGQHRKAATTQAPAPVGFDKWLTDLEAVADNGRDALNAAWLQSDPKCRTYLTNHRQGTMATLKARAAKVSS